MKKDKSMFDDIELESPINTDTKVKDVIMDTPRCTDIGWSDYVMSHFDPSELIDGKPLVCGLRRVAELLIGPIVSSGPTQVFPPKNDNEHGRATVVFKVEFDIGDHWVCYSDVADSWEGNTDDAFCVYAVATASTRAEARALRKALKIKAVAAEEITRKNTSEVLSQVNAQRQQTQVTQGEYNNDGKMTSAQGSFIIVKCKQLNINTDKLLKEVFKTNDKSVSKKVASDVIEQLNRYQRKTEDVPETILGYEAKE